VPIELFIGEVIGMLSHQRRQAFEISKVIKLGKVISMIGYIHHLPV
jgi:hypothetical protein